MSNKHLFPKPHSVSIVAMGASVADYVNRAHQHGGRHAISDETWAINAAGGVVIHDRVFAMDDLGDLRADARKGKKVANGMLGWLEEHPGPIYTSRAYHEIVPGAVEYPVEAVLNEIGFPYLNTSVAYAAAYALYLGVEDLKLFGCDFTYKNQHAGESGRGCVEWLLGIAGERGVHVEVSQNTTLMDANEPLENRLYGFNEPVVPEQDPETGRWTLTYPEREKHRNDHKPRVEMVA